MSSSVFVAASDPTRGTAAPACPENAWRVARAQRAAVLVDGDAYYRALHEALLKARSQVWILGWDIDSRLCLRRDLDAAGQKAATLSVLLDSLAQRGVQVNVLSWDFAPIYAMEREPLSAARLDWTTHRRMRFELDSTHPLGASHHQKVVVIDDSLAFAGGLDLCGARWDTPAHTIENPLRKDPGHDEHAPFHDVQMMVEGPPAALLGALCRERWRRATGERVLPVWTRGRGSRWPTSVDADFTDVNMAISRTEPGVDEHAAVREVEQLHLDSIAFAQSCIYLENQYLTSRTLCDALVASLQRERGPEIVIVVPTECSGWLEQSTMGVRRAVVVNALRAADRHGRLAVVAPVLGPDAPRLNVHAKVSIIDDRMLRVGSANLSNRSMGFDTECDLSVEAEGNEATKRSIAHVRAKLLAEHLDTSPERVNDAIAAYGLVGAVKALSGRGPRTLMTVTADDEANPVLTPLTVIADPEEPAAVDPLIRRRWDGLKPGQRRLRAGLVVAAAVVLCFGLAGLWRFTPLSELLSPARLQELLEPLLSGPLGPLVGVGVFVVGGLAFFPHTLLVVQSGLVFPPLTAVGVAFVGGLASCAVSYVIGRAVGAGALTRVLGRERMQAVARIDGRGVLAIAGLRLAPVAPFSLVNLAAGAARVRFPHFILGSALGMVPGTLALVLLGRGIVALFQETLRIDVVIVVLVAGVVATVVGRILWRRRRARSTAEEAPADKPARAPSTAMGSLPARTNP